MRFLILDAPGLGSISLVAAGVFNLRVVTHWDVDR
jgi:hypothetical protein